MNDPKPLASLSSGLLARKGQAAPAMRRQSMLLGSEPQEELPTHDPFDDLGWNDMGHETGHGQHPGRAGLSPMAHTPAPVVSYDTAEEVQPEPAPMPVVVQQQHVLAEEFPTPPAPVVAEPARKRRTATRAAPGSKAKAAFTLRLDAERHLQLRLVCAVRHRSAQQIVTEALDAFLAKHPIASNFGTPFKGN